VIFTAGPPKDGAWHEANIVAQSLETGQRHTVIPGAAQAHYLAPGYLAYARAGTVYGVPFDAAALRVTGPAVALVEEVMEHPGHGAAQFVVSANGTLAYLTGGLQTTEVVLVDRQGRARPMIPHERRLFDSPRLSPDGTRLALNVGGGNDATFVYDLAGGMLSRVTSDVNHLAPTWTPDGKQVTTRKTLEGEIVSSSIDRSGREEVLFTRPGAVPTPMAWTADRRTLFFTVDDDIWTLSLPERRAEAVIHTRFREEAPAPSPDARWLAYTSNESDRDEVYVSQLPAGQRWPVSRAGGTEPVWSRDSKWLYFRQGTKFLAVAARPPFANPVELFDAPWAYGGGLRAQYDVAPDGEEFIMIRTPDANAARIHVVLNWIEEVKRRIPR
jgi:serine/threonine-protein kinase